MPFAPSTLKRRPWNATEALIDNWR